MFVILFDTFIVGFSLGRRQIQMHFHARTAQGTKSSRHGRVYTETVVTAIKEGVVWRFLEHFQTSPLKTTGDTLLLTLELDQNQGGMREEAYLF